MNTVKENTKMGSRNDAKDIRHNEKMKKWNEYQAVLDLSKKMNK